MLRSARRALELDPNCGEAHFYGNLPSVRLPNKAPVQDAMRRALSLSPRDACLHHWAAAILLAAFKDIAKVTDRRIEFSRIDENHRRPHFMCEHLRFEPLGLARVQERFLAWAGRTYRFLASTSSLAAISDAALVWPARAST